MNEHSDAGTGQRLKVLVADDHHLVREGLKLALRQIEASVEVVEADTLGKAIEAYKAHPDLDLVLLDLTMPGTSGTSSALDGFERSCPEARVVVVSAAYDMQTVQWALRKGALGFIPKLSGKDVLLHALRFILDGGIYVPPEALLTAGLGEPGRKPGADARRETLSANPFDAGLTLRQTDVLRRLLEGKPNKQICRDLNLAMGTVKGHMAAIFAALGVGSRGEAMAAADRLGWRHWLDEHPPDNSNG